MASEMDDKEHVKLLEDATVALINERDVLKRLNEDHKNYISQLEEQVADLVIENTEVKAKYGQFKQMLDWLAMYGSHSENGCVVESDVKCSCGWNDLKRMLWNQIEWNSDQERKNES